MGNVGVVSDLYSRNNLFDRIKLLVVAIPSNREVQTFL